MLNRNWLSLAAFLALAGPVAAAEPTAFDLIKEGNRYIGEQSKDKVVQLRSEKSIAGLTPNIWWVVYYDHTAKMRTVEVKFGAGKMLEVVRPFRLLERAAHSDVAIDREKLRIDSDRAIKIATAEPLLEKLKLTATRLKLERYEDGNPVWKVRVWAAKLRRPERDADLGEVILSAVDGKVLKTDLHINRVD